jgi:hypothetical protein
MAPADFDGSWQRIAPRMVAFTSGAQLAAAQAAGSYVPAVLRLHGPSDEPSGRHQRDEVRRDRRIDHPPGVRPDGTAEGVTPEEEHRNA